MESTALQRKKNSASKDQSSLLNFHFPANGGTTSSNVTTAHQSTSSLSSNPSNPSPSNPESKDQQQQDEPVIVTHHRSGSSSRAPLKIDTVAGVAGQHSRNISKSSASKYSPISEPSDDNYSFEEPLPYHGHSYKNSLMTLPYPGHSHKNSILTPETQTQAYILGGPKLSYTARPGSHKRQKSLPLASKQHQQPPVPLSEFNLPNIGGYSSSLASSYPDSKSQQIHLFRLVEQSLSSFAHLNRIMNDVNKDLYTNILNQDSNSNNNDNNNKLDDKVYLDYNVLPEMKYIVFSSMQGFLNNIPIPILDQAIESTSNLVKGLEHWKQYKAIEQEEQEINTPSRQSRGRYNLATGPRTPFIRTHSPRHQREALQEQPPYSRTTFASVSVSASPYPPPQQQQQQQQQKKTVPPQPHQQKIQFPQPYQNLTMAPQPFIQQPQAITGAAFPPLAFPPPHPAQMPPQAPATATPAGPPLPGPQFLGPPAPIGPLAPPPPPLPPPPQQKQKQQQHHNYHEQDQFNVAIVPPGANNTRKSLASQKRASISGPSNTFQRNSIGVSSINNLSGSSKRSNSIASEDNNSRIEVATTPSKGVKRKHSFKKRTEIEERSSLSTPATSYGNETISLRVKPSKLMNPEKETSTIKPPSRKAQGQLHYELSIKQESVCSQCGTKDTPEWRRGPDGARTLCNACGLYHSKLVKKMGLENANLRFLEKRESRLKDERKLSGK